MDYSALRLGICQIEIDWSKNHLSSDHSVLFLLSDYSLVSYYYSDGFGEWIVEEKEGFARDLRSVKQRLDLLGYSPQMLCQMYNEHLEGMPHYYSKAAMSFEEFRNVLISIDVSEVSLGDGLDGDYDLGEFVSRHLFRDPEINQYIPDKTELSRDLGTFFENIDPYLTLRILAENERNLDYLVEWRSLDTEYARKEDSETFVPLDDTSKILVVTEGSSDSFIIKRALEKLRPNIADFFYFVDMEEHYPFTGTGSLFKFCQGLSRIRIQNNVLIIFDNDAAGVEKLQQSQALEKPSNMHFCRLPDHDMFSSFKTIGPNGVACADINGSAVAIECFLDLQKIEERDQYVRWTSYNRRLQRYQGEIEGKDKLVKAFKKANLTDGSFDTSMLELLLDHLANEWITRI